MLPAVREELPFQGARQEGARVRRPLCEQVHGHDEPDLSHLPGGPDSSINLESPVIPFMFLFSDCALFHTYHSLVLVMTETIGRVQEGRQVTHDSFWLNF